ncbi:hypothetical protein A2U01_0116977, partial [Trifolium medium]|nr:hypothetical protein [Trifolium medium]
MCLQRLKVFRGSYCLQNLEVFRALQSSGLQCLQSLRSSKSNVFRVHY